MFGFAEEEEVEIGNISIAVEKRIVYVSHIKWNEFYALGSFYVYLLSVHVGLARCSLFLSLVSDFT